LGHGRIALVVDDEELMRISAKRMLERFGFVVHTAHQGEAAVAMLLEDPSRVHLVLLDMIMPVLSGPEAFGKMREIRPDLPILLCSGFARESQTDELLSQGNTRFLLKPFGLDALEKAIVSLSAF
jgi:CheY-like chemotaxis protein